MDLLRDRVKPMYFKYLFAASGSALVASVFSVVDAMAVGNYHGPAGNAALAVFSPLWSIIYSLGLLAGIGGSVLFANARGRQDEKTAQEFFTISVFFGIALSALTVLGIVLFNEPMFRLFGADDSLLVLAQRYLIPILFAVPCCLCSNILSAFLRNDGNPELATKAVIIGGVCNVFGDYFFVFALDMGILGAGLATAIGQYIAIAVMLLHFVSKKNTLRFVKPTDLLQKLGSISITGFSTAISDLSMGIIGVLFNRQIMRYLGADALAIYGILTQITAFVQCLSYGTGQAAQPIISQNYGAGQYGRIRECTKYGLYTSVAMGLVWTGIMLVFPDGIVRLFMMPTPTVLEMAPRILRIYGLSYALLPFNIFATYFFQALMKPNISLAASVARGAVVSGVLILLLPVIAGGDNIWFAMLLTESLVAAFCAWHILRCTINLCRKVRK